MKESLTYKKAFAFSKRIVSLYKYLCKEGCLCVEKANEALIPLDDEIQQEINRCQQRQAEK